MALQVDNKITINDNGRRFWAVKTEPEQIINEKYWDFQYKHDEPGIVGTIFFDGGKNSSIYISSTISNIVINSVPPKFNSLDASYITKYSRSSGSGQFQLKVTFSDEVPLDVAQVVIAVGDISGMDPVDIPQENLLFRTLRKPGSQYRSNTISDLRMSKNGSNYTLSFRTDETVLLPEDAAAEQITVIVWDISANYTVYTTDEDWKVLKDVSNGELAQLIMELTPEPGDMLIGGNVEGQVLVRISNPNVALRNICPTVELASGSIGYIDESTMTFDPETGVLLFYVTNISTTGTVIVNAWIDVTNTEIRDVVKSATFVTGQVGPFLIVEEGRKYKFYTPSYISDENYGAFIKFTETFLNSCQYGTTNTSRVSNLEKIARIGDFNDISKVEPSYLNCYKDQFNYEVTPNFDEYVYYMYYRPDQNDD